MNTKYTEIIAEANVIYYEAHKESADYRSGDCYFADMMSRVGLTSETYASVGTVVTFPWGEQLVFTIDEDGFGSRDLTLGDALAMYS